MEIGLSMGGITGIQKSRVGNTKMPWASPFCWYQMSCVCGRSDTRICPGVRVMTCESQNPLPSVGGHGAVLEASRPACTSCGVSRRHCSVVIRAH